MSGENLVASDWVLIWFWCGLGVAACGVAPWLTEHKDDAWLFCYCSDNTEWGKWCCHPDGCSCCCGATRKAHSFSLSLKGLNVVHGYFKYTFLCLLMMEKTDSLAALSTIQHQKPPPHRYLFFWVIKHTFSIWYGDIIQNEIFALMFWLFKQLILIFWRVIDTRMICCTLFASSPLSPFSETFPDFILWYNYPHWMAPLVLIKSICWWLI